MSLIILYTKPWYGMGTTIIITVIIIAIMMIIIKHFSVGRNKPFEKSAHLHFVYRLLAFVNKF